jgi:hypothetical protein
VCFDGGDVVLHNSCLYNEFLKRHFFARVSKFKYECSELFTAHKFKKEALDTSFIQKNLEYLIHITRY